MAEEIAMRNRKPPSAKAEEIVGTSVHSEYTHGETYDGEKFLVPKTADTVAAFVDPKWMNIGTIVASIPVITMFFLTFVVKIPLWVNFVVFFFWRAMYNAGLGWLLDIQSRERRLTSWYTYWAKYPESWQYKVIYRFTVAGLPAGKKPEDYPIAFNAWIVYKAFVNLVLVNDSTNYVWIVLRCFDVPAWEDLSITLLFQYFVAFLLFAFFWWSKVDAHRCIGTYCWYWGDFFYRKNVNLTFDGIFELFPHPMYTVGYSSYYGSALLSRSYIVLLVSIAAHIAQLMFLVIVEEPHIKRTYGDGETAVPVQQLIDNTPIYDDKTGLFPSKKTQNIYSFLAVNIYSSSSWMMAIVCCYSIALGLLPENRIWSVIQVIIWRFIHWFVLGFVLYSQSKSERFTKYYTNRGMTIREAFSNWKAIHGLSTTVNVLTFLVCVWRYLPEFSYDAFFSIASAARGSVAIAMILISYWTFYSTYTSVGDFGWFYGDFFVRPANYASNLCYTGIYRFLNNPDAALGYAGYYGLSFISSSWVIFWLTVLSQVLNMIFVRVVEAEHMQKIYNSDAIRTHSPLRNKVLSVVEKSTTVLPASIKNLPKQKKLQDQVKNVQKRALMELHKLYCSIDKDELDHEEGHEVEQMTASLQSQLDQMSPTICPSASNEDILFDELPAASKTAAKSTYTLPASQSNSDDDQGIESRDNVADVVSAEE